ncbi:hypothetical protein CDCA_CDCA16G4186 [Cyanidium caldarium]|uniref:30S ribosomal protein S15 n=1 Tax=Cyanidium caldarium TaxID=2771 RepID=A0AAV9J1B2_CYACA|nr:hypothetical protein CDCA_CDCA16G4186 [Cyanidium caldarium]
MLPAFTTVLAAPRGRWSARTCTDRSRPLRAAARRGVAHLSMQESEPQWLPDLLDELGSTPASESLASDEVENDVERPQSYELPVECVPRPYLNYLRIRDRREPFKRHDKDSGSPEFQIATLTERIQIITEHLKEHRKDNSAVRGLQLLNSQRKRLLRYLQMESRERYDTLVAALGLRISREEREIMRKKFGK